VSRVVVPSRLTAYARIYFLWAPWRLRLRGVLISLTARRGGVVVIEEFA